jgi:nucleotide-binding universal stress UspA family protein
MRVLAATDLSRSADAALRLAAALAGPGGVLAVVHVLPALQPVSMLFPQRHAQDSLDVAQLTVRVTDAVRERVARISGCDAEIFVEEGAAYAAIVKRADAWMADVIVVGSHGHSGLERLVGGVAERVVRYARCRVLVVRESPASGLRLGSDRPV